jgi:nitroimidazol reductase NimA-like FMN-containing flavoprotein (pyridoxamine 5'-phosphate oxidase superfamily)
MSWTVEDRASVVDHSGLDTLSFESSLRLLASSPMGRVAFREDGEVLILPVFHAMDGQDVVFRTAGGSLLDLAARGEPVSFEADGPTPSDDGSWSVLVTGVAHLVLDAEEERRLDALELVRWGEGEDRFWVRIRPSAVSGRRVPHLRGDSAGRR